MSENRAAGKGDEVRKCPACIDADDDGRVFHVARRNAAVDADQGQESSDFDPRPQAAAEALEVEVSFFAFSFFSDFDSVLESVFVSFAVSLSRDLFLPA